MKKKEKEIIKMAENCYIYFPVPKLPKDTYKDYIKEPPSEEISTEILIKPKIDVYENYKFPIEGEINENTKKTKMIKASKT